VNDGKKLPNHLAIHTYPLFLLYRLIYSMIPAIFYNNPVFQIQAVILLTLAYLIVLANLKTQLNPTDYYIDLFSEFMLLMMQTHMFWFIDGGILNGTPNKVSSTNYIWFLSQIDSSFVACGLSITLFVFSNFGNFLVKYCILLYKKKENFNNHLK